MFYNCTFTALDLSNFNTSNVTRMTYMFSGCSSLTTLDLSNFDTSKVTDMNYMFRFCSGLITIYASNLWSLNSLRDSKGMFNGCEKLVGDIPFDPNYTDATYAKTSGGYLTYKAA